MLQCVFYWSAGDGALVRVDLLGLAEGSSSELSAETVLEVVHQFGGALDAGVGEFTNLLAIEETPSSAVEVLMELRDELGMGEIGESIAHIARVVLIDR